jgi:hypothetical protein
VLQVRSRRTRYQVRVRTRTYRLDSIIDDADCREKKGAKFALCPTNNITLSLLLDYHKGNNWILWHTVEATDDGL